MCVCLERGGGREAGWQGGGTQRSWLCTLTKHTHTHMEWITISTQFNEKCRPISKMYAAATNGSFWVKPPTTQTNQPPTHLAPSLLGSLMGRVRKISAFSGGVWRMVGAAPKTICFPNGISIYVACCAHISANAFATPPARPLLPLAPAHPLAHICTPFRNCNWVWVFGAFAFFGALWWRHLVHCLFPFCGAQIGTFAVSRWNEIRPGTRDQRPETIPGQKLIELPNWEGQSNG